MFGRISTRARACRLCGIFLQWIIENRCFKIRECARMVFFAEDDGGVRSGLARDMQIMGRNACMSVLICNLHIPRGNG